MGAGDGHEGGDTVEAGLPNITGVTYFRGLGIVNNKNQSVVWDTTIGAITTNESTGEDASSYKITYEKTDYSTNKSGKFSFDASNSNLIYGASDTVQPPAYYVYIWRRAS